MEKINLIEQKITTIQAMIRSSQVREKYVVNQLADNESENYKTFVIGNDPKMPKELDKYAEPDDKIALIATSGMRAVSLACKLGNPHQLPKIFLVDNSLQVITFWKEMQRFIQDKSKADTQELFLQHLPDFLYDHRHLYRQAQPDDLTSLDTSHTHYLTQDIPGYFSALINKYGYDYIRKVILHAAVMRQSWADLETFQKIKNITGYLGINKIYMYPSNIVGCIDDQKTRNEVLENIAAFSPVLSIHTDAWFPIPEKVFLFTNQDPQTVKSTLFPTSFSHPASKINNHGLDILLNLLAVAMQKQQSHSNKIVIDFLR